MSSELYEVLSLAARYLFALLGVLIVLRSFFWLLSERAERRRTVRRMPWSGTVGELVVVSGSRDLPEGTVIPVPWEGILEKAVERYTRLIALGKEGRLNRKYLRVI